MRRLLLCVLFVCLPLTAQAWLAGYQYRRAVTCGGQNVTTRSGTVSNPTCVLRVSDNASPGGDVMPSFTYANVYKSATCSSASTGTTCDVRFTDTSDSEYKFKIDMWNVSGKDSVCTGNCSTFEVGPIASITTAGVGGTIYMYYGNPVPTTDANVNGNPYVATAKFVYANRIGSGTSMADDTGQYTATLSAAGITYNAVGRLGNALSFDGASGHGMVSPDIDLLSGMSLMIWINPNTTISTEMALLYKGFGPSNYEYLYDISGTNNYFFQLCADSGCAAWIGRKTSTAQVPASGAWGHFAATWSGGTTNASVKLYKNGVAVDNTDYSNGSFGGLVNGSANIGIAQTAAGVANLNAIVDDVRVYSNTLGADDIAFIYDADRGAANTLNNECAPGVPARPLEPLRIDFNPYEERAPEAAAPMCTGVSNEVQWAAPANYAWLY